MLNVPVTENKAKTITSDDTRETFVISAVNDRKSYLFREIILYKFSEIILFQNSLGLKATYTLVYRLNVH